MDLRSSHPPCTDTHAQGLVQGSAPLCAQLLGLRVQRRGLRALLGHHRCKIKLLVGFIVADAWHRRCYYRKQGVLQTLEQYDYREKL
jgi:hypothetical protein